MRRSRCLPTSTSAHSPGASKIATRIQVSQTRQLGAGSVAVEECLTSLHRLPRPRCGWVPQDVGDAGGESSRIARSDQRAPTPTVQRLPNLAY